MPTVPQRYEPNVPLEKLQPSDENPNVGDVGAISTSIEANDFYGAVYVREGTGTILGGEHRWRAAQALGESTIPVIWITARDDAHARRIMLADNRTAELAHRDQAQLAEILQGIIEEGGPEGLTGTGYDGDDLDEILRDAGLGEEEERGGFGSGPKDDPVTEYGHLWQLGSHRLLCGDAFKAADLDRLVDGARVDMLLTDPPYGIDLDTDYSTMSESNVPRFPIRPSKGYDPIVGDAEAFDAGPLVAYFEAVVEQFWFGADYYRRTLSADDRDGSWLVWDKRNETSDGGFGSGFELVWSRQGHKRDLLRHYYFGTFGVEAANRLHPTQKPTPLLAEILTRWSKVGQTVCDPFAGSGSTLIAAHRTDRVAYLAEIDPGYCDVICARWQRESGLLPFRDGTEVDFCG